MQGICFKEPLFHATIERRKTQTRRVIDINVNARIIEDHGDQIWCELDCEQIIARSRYEVGEIAYLKEPYCYHDMNEGGKFIERVIYKFDMEAEYAKNFEWKNKLFMPASAARYFIKITDVRAERLQDISEIDCIREGIEKMHVLPLREYISQNYPGFGEREYYSNGDGEEYDNARLAYAALINAINGKGTWYSNPYVWVYDYEIHKPE